MTRPDQIQFFDVALADWLRTQQRPDERSIGLTAKRLLGEYRRHLDDPDARAMAERLRAALAALTPGS